MKLSEVLLKNTKPKQITPTQEIKDIEWSEINYTPKPDRIKILEDKIKVLEDKIEELEKGK